MSNLSLERVEFDPSNVSDGPSIGSYIVSASGTVIDDTSGALDVNIANASVVVSASDLDIRDLTSASDSVEIKTAAGQALAIDGSGYITANINGSVTVTASDLDIRDLTSASDSVEIKTAAGQALAIDGSGYITANINGSVTVTASDLDIRDLTHASDSVKIGDGTEFLAVNADGSINVNLTDDGIADGAADSGNPFKVGSHAYDQASALTAVDADDRANLASDLYRRVFINDAPNIAVSTAAVSVTDSATALFASVLAGRTRALIQNLGAQDMYVGGSGVTTSNGLLVGKGSTLSLELGQAVALYGIVATGSSSVRVMQLA